MLTKNIGQVGENIAKNYLINKGYKIIDSNFNIHDMGEIDIIALNNDSIYFYEVKYRSNLEYGFPIESITNYKLARLHKSINYFLLKYPNYNSFKKEFKFLSIFKEDSNVKIEEYSL